MISTLVSPNLQSPQSMNNGDMPNAKAFRGFSCQIAHLFRRHLLVGLVVKVERLATAGVIAHDAIENNNSTIRAVLGNSNKDSALMTSRVRRTTFAREPAPETSVVLEAPPETGGSKPTSSFSRRIVSRWRTRR